MSSFFEDAIEAVRNQTLFNKNELIEKFGWEEYLIFALMLSVSAGIGIFYWWRGQNNNAEFLLGGRSMGVFPMTMSLVASFMSAITLLGTPAEVYQNGTQYCLLVLSYPLVMAATAYFYMPVFYKLGVSTSYEVCNMIGKIANQCDRNLLHVSSHNLSLVSGMEI